MTRMTNCGIHLKMETTIFTLHSCHQRQSRLFTRNLLGIVRPGSATALNPICEMMKRSVDPELGDRRQPALKTNPWRHDRLLNRVHESITTLSPAIHSARCQELSDLNKAQVQRYISYFKGVSVDRFILGAAKFVSISVSLQHLKWIFRRPVFAPREMWRPKKGFVAIGICTFVSCSGSGIVFIYIYILLRFLGLTFWHPVAKWPLVTCAAKRERLLAERESEKTEFISDRHRCCSVFHYTIQKLSMVQCDPILLAISNLTSIAK